MNMENNVKEKGFISVEAVKHGAERCPYCGNKIFFTYASKNGIPQTIKCTACQRAYDNDGKTFFVER